MTTSPTAGPTTTLPAHQALALDLARTPPVPMTRLAGVEFRKALDTRAGRWLAISILALVLVVEVIYSFAADDASKGFHTYLAIAGGVLGYFLPILIIMLVTSEASQRNGLITFTLEPRRPRVVTAKFIAGVALALSVLLVAVVLAVVGTLVGLATGGVSDWSVSGHEILNAFLLSNLIGIFVGFAIAMLIMNTAGAIVGYFGYSLILPIAAGILSALSDTLDRIIPWVEFNTAQAPLITGNYSPTGEEWAQIAVAGFIWLIVPLVLGTMRLLRIEFK